MIGLCWLIVLELRCVFEDRGLDYLICVNSWKRKMKCSLDFYGLGEEGLYCSILILIVRES